MAVQKALHHCMADLITIQQLAEENEVDDVLPYRRMTDLQKVLVKPFM